MYIFFSKVEYTSMSCPSPILASRPLPASNETSPFPKIHYLLYRVLAFRNSLPPYSARAADQKMLSPCSVCTSKTCSPLSWGRTTSNLFLVCTQNRIQGTISLVYFWSCDRGEHILYNYHKINFFLRFLRPSWSNTFARHKLFLNEKNVKAYILQAGTLQHPQRHPI